MAPTPIQPMRSPLSYIGGKNRIKKQIVERFPDHDCYVEAFAGGLQVLFEKPPSRVEAINDLDRDVVNFFRCLQQHPEEVARYLKYAVVSREWFDDLNKQNPSTITDIQRAARFFYLQKNAFGGLVKGRHYALKVTGAPGFDSTRLPEIFETAHQRLARVQIESLPYDEVIRRFDRPSTLFYCDPPYWKRPYYNVPFTEEDQRKLAHLLQSLKGKFVLSIDDVPEIRKLYRDSKISEIELPYTAQREAGKRFPELIVTNF